MCSVDIKRTCRPRCVFQHTVLYSSASASSVPFCWCWRPYRHFPLSSRGAAQFLDRKAEKARRATHKLHTHNLKDRQKGREMQEVYGNYSGNFLKAFCAHITCICQCLSGPSQTSQSNVAPYSHNTMGKKAHEETPLCLPEAHSSQCHRRDIKEHLPCHTWHLGHDTRVL